MKITANKIDTHQLIIYVAGKINIVTAETFRKEVNRLSAGFGNVVFDFGGVNYISSAGLREILIFRKKFVDMQIVNMQREVYLIFEVTGFTNFIRIECASNKPKSSEVLNEVDAPEKSNDIRVPLKDFLRDKAADSPDEICFVSDGENFSWQDIDRCATIIAADLSAVNVKH